MLCFCVNWSSAFGENSNSVTRQLIRLRIVATQQQQQQQRVTPARDQK